MNTSGECDSNSKSEAQCDIFIFQTGLKHKERVVDGGPRCYLNHFCFLLPSHHSVARESARPSQKMFKSWSSSFDYLFMPISTVRTNVQTAEASSTTYLTGHRFKISKSTIVCSSNQHLEWPPVTAAFDCPTAYVTASGLFVCVYCSQFNTTPFFKNSKPLEIDRSKLIIAQNICSLSNFVNITVLTNNGGWRVHTNSKFNSNEKLANNHKW